VSLLRQHTSAYVSIRQHTSAYETREQVSLLVDVCSAQDTCAMH